MTQTWTRTVEPLVLTAIAHNMRVVGFTSHCRNSGVSMVAAAVAENFARSGLTTLLVDMSRPCEEESKADGSWVVGQSDPKRWLKRDARGFDVLLARPTAQTRFLFNNAANLRDAFTVDLENYRAIVVDLPPVVEAPGQINPLAAAAACDAVNLICLAGLIDRAGLASVVRSMQSAGVKVTGTIVNEVGTPRLGIAIARELGRVRFIYPQLVAWLQRRALASRLLNS